MASSPEIKRYRQLSKLPPSVPEWTQEISNLYPDAVSTGLLKQDFQDLAEISTLEARYRNRLDSNGIPLLIGGVSFVATIALGATGYNFREALFFGAAAVAGLVRACWPNMAGFKLAEKVAVWNGQGQNWLYQQMTQENFPANPGLTTDLHQQYQRAICDLLIDLEQKILLGRHMVTKILDPIADPTQQTGLVIPFSWRTRSGGQNIIVDSTLPMDGRIRRAEEVGQPLTVSFKFNPHHFIGIDRRALHDEPTQAIRVIRYDYPGDYINPGAILQADFVGSFGS